MSTAADRVQWPPNSGGAAIVGKVVIVGGESGSSSRPECGAAQLDARYRRAIVVVTAVAAVWRLGYLVATKWNQQLLFNDSLYYSSQAYENAHGNWFRDFPGAHPGAEHGPLTSLVLTPASLLSHHEFWQRATNTIVGIAVVPLIALLARRLAGRRVAVIAAVIAALYPNLWMNDSLVMAESISTLLVIVAMLVALRFRERLDIRSALVCGAVVGLAALARSELLILVPVFALLARRSCYRVRPPIRRGGSVLEGL